MTEDLHRGDQQERPDWIAANPARIARRVERALARPSGGWLVLGSASEVRPGPRRYIVDGIELVAWRGSDGLRVAPGACPHMGGPLGEGRVTAGRLVCPWHGLALGDEAHGMWRCLPAHDDGVLAWVRLPDAAPTDAPILAARVPGAIPSVIAMAGRCEPRDVLENRFDPWHGTWYHPYAFLRLAVLDEDEDSVTVRVAYRVVGRIGVEVEARFASPEPNTIAMTIVAGAGTGSVVETHATPIGPGRCRIVEAITVHSDRRGFQFARRLAPVVSRAAGIGARRLWRDDVRYAERRYAVRREARGS